jgi:hypothetical protein
MRTVALIVLATTAFLAVPPASASAETVVVQDAYIDLHSGPGRVYPVTQVVERGGEVELLRQRTDWIKVRTDRGREGWVHRDQLERTLTGEGAEVRLAGPRPEARTGHRWEVSLVAGDFDGADLIMVSAAYMLTDTMYLRADVSQVLGQYSNGYVATVGIGNVLAPQWPVSPFVTIGGGAVWVDPNATLVQSPTRSNGTAYAGAGLRGYLSDRFLLQAEYREYLVLLDTNQNEVIGQWSVGFTHFF